MLRGMVVALVVSVQLGDASAHTERARESPGRRVSGVRESNPFFKLGKLALNQSTNPAVLFSIVRNSLR